MKQYDNTSPKGPRQDIDMETNKYPQVSVPVTDWKRHTHQWQLTATRSKITWKVKTIRCSDILHRRPGPHGTSNQTLPLQEQTRTSAWEAYDAPRNKHTHTSHTQGVSSSPASLSMTCWQELCITNTGTDIGTSSSWLSWICSHCCSCASFGCRVISLFVDILIESSRLSLGSIGAEDGSLAVLK